MTRFPRGRLDEILAAARDVRVLVVGDVMLDRYLTGSVDRISPEAPVPVLRVEGERDAVGGAGNVAANAVALGAACTLVGLVGADPDADRLREALGGLGVSVDGLVSHDGRPTTVKTRVLARSQQIVRVDREEDGETEAPLTAELEAMARARVAEADVVVLEDYNKGVLSRPVIRAVIDEANARDIPSVVDPKRLHFFDFEEVTVFKPNAKELAEALGERLQSDDPDWLESVRNRLACGSLLLTLGERGMVLRSGAGDFLRIPAVARSVYDVSGAGDTVTAVMAVCLAAGGSVEEGALIANHAAAIEVAKAGVATVSPDEIRDQIQRHENEPETP